MQQSAIFQPMIVLMVLTYCVLLIMVKRRGADARAKGLSVNQIPPVRQDAKSGGEKLWSQSTAAAGDNINNLFETPTLFYATCIGLYVLQAISTPLIIVAWAYVGARIVHSFIHLTYNLVMHRLLAFVTSLLLLLVLIFHLALAAF